MLQFVLFILATVGMSWTITRSMLFKSYREYFSRKEALYSICVKSTETKSLKNTIKYKFFWAISTLNDCYGCCGFWSGVGIYMVQKHNGEVIVYAFSGITGSLILIGLHKYLEKK